MLTITFASSVKFGFEMTAGVAAVIDVSSLASIDSFVVKIELPVCLTSTIIVDPTGAMFTDALTEFKYIPKGTLNVTADVVVVKLVDSSLQATMKSSNLQVAEFYFTVV